VVLGLLILAACGGAQDPVPVQSTPTTAPTPESKQDEGVSPMTVVATINTNHGAIVIDMFPKEAPKTVDNFVTLSRDGFYDGVIFHRVIPNFMIQGGDPTGTGAGGPGYKFEDEFDPSLRFDKPGLLAMANSGPDTNGSQFFITTAPTPHLNNAHTIFGKVTQGQDVVEAISRVQTGQGDKPLEDVVIQGVQIDESSGG
jgi:peptidyl-prolyl cis-trans isomerase A (cyclophilin A)